MAGLSNLKAEILFLQPTENTIKKFHVSRIFVYDAKGEDVDDLIL